MLMRLIYDLENVEKIINIQKPLRAPLATPEVYTQPSTTHWSCLTLPSSRHSLPATHNIVLRYLYPHWVAQWKRLIIVCFSQWEFTSSFEASNSWSDIIFFHVHFVSFLLPRNATWKNTVLFTIVRLWIIFKVIKQQNRDHFLDEANERINKKRRKLNNHLFV
jgi:hypothetical protein